MELLDILINWINEEDSSQFWFIKNEVICCWPKGWELPVAAFMIDNHIIRSLETGIVLKNNLKAEYSIYDPNCFEDLKHAMLVHKKLYSSVII